MNVNTLRALLYEYTAEFPETNSGEFVNWQGKPLFVLTDDELVRACTIVQSMIANKRSAQKEIDKIGMATEKRKQSMLWPSFG